MSGSEDRPRILVVDDEPFIRDILADFLTMEGYEVSTAADGAVALRELSARTFDLVLTDLKMPNMGGIELLDAASRASPDTLTVIMTGFGTVETAIDAMKRGAYDYILKPFKVEEVVRVIQKGVDRQRLATENLRLREAVSLYKVTEAIGASLSLEQVLASISEVAIDEIRGDVVTTWLLDDGGQLFERARVVSQELPPEAFLGTLEPLAFEEAFRKAPFVLEHGGITGRFYRSAPDLSVVSMLAIPFRAKDKILGFVTVMSHTKRRRFDEGRRKLLSIVASRASAAIENAKLYEDLRSTFHQTISGLATAIDKMDRYTAGHSERVAGYAVRIASRLLLPLETVEHVRQSALMHDIGKLGCVLNLNKPGRLTVEEYEAFKRHPAYGRDILEPIKFLEPIVPGVYAHHERWDGRGYPLGLAGNDVPLLARIISVADTYDAMTTDRAYRKALPHQVAVDEVDRCTGSQFDPSIASEFLVDIDELRAECKDRGKSVPP